MLMLVVLAAAVLSSLPVILQNLFDIHSLLPSYT